MFFRLFICSSFKKQKKYPNIEIIKKKKKKIEKYLPRLHKDNSQSSMLKEEHVLKECR